MPEVAAIIAAIEALAPLIEDVVKAIRTGTVPDSLDSLPDTLRSRVALTVRKAQGK